jgi:hypothetical protein
MVPVAVSVPNNVKNPIITMTFDNWAFGEIVATPRN